MIDIRAHGALPAGAGANAAVNTAAIQAAVTEALATKEGREVYIPDRTAFDPDAVDWGWPRQLSTAISGQVYPTTTWTIRDYASLRGVGGMAGTGFLIARPAYVMRPAGLAIDKATVRVTGNSNKILQDLSIDGGAGIGLHLDDAPNTIMERVGAATLENAPGSIGLQINDSYWVWARDCVFKCGQGGSASIYITNVHPGGNGTGNIVFDGLRMARGPIVLDYGVGSATGAIGIIRVSDATLEIPDRCFIQVTEGSVVRAIDLQNCGMADASWFAASTVVGFVENLGTIKALTVGSADTLFNSPTFVAGRAPEQIRYDAPAVPTRWASGNRHPAKGVLVADGEMEAAAALRGIADPIQSQPFPALDVPRDPLNWTRSSQTLAVEPAATDPRGLNAAADVEWPADQSGLALLKFWSAKREWIDGEWLIAGVWLRNGSPDLETEAPAQANPMFCAAPGASGWILNETYPSIEFPSEILRQPSAGWAPIVRAVQLTKSRPDATVNTLFEFMIRLRPGNRFRVWQPFLLRPGAGWTAREIMRVAKTLTRLPGDVAPGHVGTDEDVTFKTGRGSVRPDAALVGDGAQWFDTALGRPIWAHGGVWVTACGAVAP